MRILLSALVCLLGASATALAQEDANPGVGLWDTGSSSESGTVDLARKETWRRIEAGPGVGALTGDAVIENERITVVFGRRSAGPILGPRAAAEVGRVVAPSRTDGFLGDSSSTSRLVVTTPAKEVAVRLTAINVRTNDDDQVTLEVSARTQSGQEIRTLYRVARGQSFVECRPVENAGGIRVEAATRFVVIPDFFGADMVFDPAAYPQSNLIIPPENFVLGMLEGESTIVMSVWPAGDQQVELALAGAKEQRRIAATEITFDRKSVFIAVLHAPGLWHARRLPEPYIDKDLSLDWKKPFDAKWRANFCAQHRSDSWDFQDHRSETWMYLYQAIVWPCWFDAEDGFVRLSRRFINVKGPMELVLAYPADRRKGTPLATLTPVDIVRNTLGVGPCEYVLDREGLQGRSANTGRKNFGRGVCDTTTPIEYLFMQGLETRESALVGHLVDDILADISAINARVLEFCAFAKELRALGASTLPESPAARQLLEQVYKTAQDIDARYQEQLPIIKNPAQAAKTGNRIKELTVRTDPENLGDCKTLTRELREIAGTQHLMVGDYRVLVKRLRQEAAIQGTEDTSTARLAEKIRKTGAQVLRRKYGVEAD